MPFVPGISVLPGRSSGQVVSVKRLECMKPGTRPMLMSYTLLDGRIYSEIAARLITTKAGGHARLGHDISLAQDYWEPRGG